MKKLIISFCFLTTVSMHGVGSKQNTQQMIQRTATPQEIREWEKLGRDVFFHMNREYFYTGDPKLLEKIKKLRCIARSTNDLSVKLGEQLSESRSTRKTRSNLCTRITQAAQEAITKSYAIFFKKNTQPRSESDHPGVHE